MSLKSAGSDLLHSRSEVFSFTYFRSLHIESFPITFLVSLSFPSASHSYLHSTFPRSIVALLRVKTFCLPAGEPVLEDILLKARLLTLL